MDGEEEMELRSEVKIRAGRGWAEPQEPGRNPQSGGRRLGRWGGGGSEEESMRSGCSELISPP